MAEHVLIDNNLTVGAAWVRVDITASDGKVYPYSNLAVKNIKSIPPVMPIGMYSINLQLSFNGGKSYVTIREDRQYVVPDVITGALFVRADPQGTSGWGVRCEIGATSQKP